VEKGVRSERGGGGGMQLENKAFIIVKFFYFAIN